MNLREPTLDHAQSLLARIFGAWLAVVAALSASSAQAASAIHWIDDADQRVEDALIDPGDAFVTTFRTAGDVTVTLLTRGATGRFNDFFAGSTPGNNPVYLTTFVGSAADGTGNESLPGLVGFLNMSGSSTGSLRFDFATPLTPTDRILFVDTDSNEQYRVEAFGLAGATYVPLGSTGWNYETFSGQTGVPPDASWPTWDGASGLLTASSFGSNEALAVLTPDSSVSRLVITKLSGAGYSTGFQVIATVPEPTGAAVGLVALCPLVVVARSRKRPAR